MIFVALTKPKKKLGAVLKLLFLILLLGVIVPYTYIALSEAGAMESYVQTLQSLIQTETAPGEPIRVHNEQSDSAPVQTVWYQIRNLLTGEELLTDTMILP